jgi:N-methylhydantoinase B/oxoprolinase/acetone carboxylase alpha subunit
VACFTSVGPPHTLFSVEGAGFGDPRDRDPERVAADVADGKVSA